MPGAGSRREHLRFEERHAVADDGYGNLESNWRLRFHAMCELKPIRGNETVIASRLAGVQPYLIRVQSTQDSRLVTTGWRAVDVRDDKRIFNIKSGANFDSRNRYIDFVAETGVPT